MPLNRFFEKKNLKYKKFFFVLKRGQNLKDGALDLINRTTFPCGGCSCRVEFNLTESMEQISFLAFDLGATSGRSILGTLCDGKLQMKELTRFPNQILELGGHYYWNIFSLYEHLKAGMVACVKEGVKITSIGIDTWGVDFALIGEDGQILGMPLAYRDLHTTGAPEEYFKNVMSREGVYGLTGIQVMNFNSLYQLYAMKRDNSSPLKAAVRALFMPDALSYMLTGKMVTEYTIASTSQVLNPRTKKMEEQLLEKMGVKGSLFGEVVPTGTVIGTLTDALAAETGIGKVPVVAVAGHDTASAVAAVPAADEKFAYLSSGTWSLMGIEVKEPVITEETAALNITNEGGVEGTTRLLKNITGMWILEQCIKEWKKEGVEYSYPEIVKMAEGATPFQSFIDPDDPSFANPPSMTAAIREFCSKSGQPVPQTHPELIRCIFESLAIKYKDILEKFRALAPFPIEKLHVIGGGSKNKLLDQLTANAIGIPVVAGPSEATAIGNIMLQAWAAGCVNSLQQMRDMIAKVVETETFLPQDTTSWNEAYAKIKHLLK